MAKQTVLIGQTDFSVLVFIPDPASTDGSGKTGLVAANLTVSGVRVETDNDITVIDYTSSLNDLAALTTAHTDWGVKEVSATLAPGLYRLDIADAIFAAGAWSAVVYVMITTSAAAAAPMEFVLGSFTPYSGVLPAASINRASLDPDTGLQPIRSFTAQAGGASTITFDAGASAVDNFYTDDSILTVGGTGAGQFRSITGYVGSTKVATVDSAWLTNPDSTTKAIVVPSAMSATDLATAVWANATRTLTAATNITSTGGTTVPQTGDVFAKFAGITLLAQWLGLIAGKQVGNSTARTELRATGAGSGTYDETTDSQEAMKDAGTSGLDAAGVRSAIGLASANLDTQLDALPTNAELATALAAADDAVLAQVALVKAKTDSLTFTQAGHVDANIQRVNDVLLIGNGAGTPWGP